MGQCYLLSFFDRNKEFFVEVSQQTVCDVVEQAQDDRHWLIDPKADDFNDAIIESL